MDKRKIEGFLMEHETHLELWKQRKSRYANEIHVQKRYIEYHEKEIKKLKKLLDP